MAISPLTAGLVPAYIGNYSPNQGYSKTHVTIHHAAGTANAAGIAGIFTTPGRNGSTHYCIDEYDIINCLDEEACSWSDGNWDSNCTTISTELRNEYAGGDWKVSDATLANAHKWVAEIHKRRGWGVPSRATVKYHQQYSSTACCGPYLIARFDEFIAKCAEVYNGQTIKDGWKLENGKWYCYDKGRLLVREFHSGTSGIANAWLNEQGYTDTKLTGWVNHISGKCYRVINGYRATQPGTDGKYKWDRNGLIDWSGINMTRINGTNRDNTSVLAAQKGVDEGTLKLDKVYFVQSANPAADGIVAASLAGGKYPILYLNDRPDSNGDQRAFVKKYAAQIKEPVFVGGVASISDAVAKSITDILK